VVFLVAACFLSTDSGTGAAAALGGMVMDSGGVS
jgi:hypothetical protein